MRHKGLSLYDIVHHRLHLEQLLHVDGAVFHIVAVEVHEAEVAERHSTAMQHIVLQGGIIIIGVAEPHGTLYFHGQPFVAVADKHIQHNERIIVLKDSFVHYFNFRLAKVVPGLRNLFGELRRRVGRHVNTARKHLVCQHTHIGASLELGPLLDAELVAQIRVLLLHVQCLLALQPLDISRFGKNVHVQLV